MNLRDLQFNRLFPFNERVKSLEIDNLKKMKPLFQQPTAIFLIIMGLSFENSSQQSIQWINIGSGAKYKSMTD